MRVAYGFAARAPVEIGMHHLADDRTRADDRHLHDDVIEAGRLETRQRRHLRARFNLEDPDRVGVAQHTKHGRVVRWEMSKVHKRTLEQI